MERLQKIIARSGLCSRRAAEELIRAGRVQVDGQKVTTQGCKLEEGKHQILVDGKPLARSSEKIYILLHKPVGYVTTLHDPQGRPIVSSLLDSIPQRLFPVGRLDFDTSGALLMTNDGDLAQRIQHPSFEVEKSYEAQVKGRPSATALRKLEKGVMVEGKMTSPAKVKLLHGSDRSSRLRLTIHEGRKRQVRKMCATVGHPVLTLCRVAYGQLQLGSLPAGQFRPLSKSDLSRIFQHKQPSSAKKKSAAKRRFRGRKAS